MGVFYELNKDEVKSSETKLKVSVVVCDMFVKEEDEIEERIDLGRLVYGDEGMKVNASESVDSEFMVMEVDEFQDYVHGGEMNFICEGNIGTLADEHGRNIRGNLMKICLPYTKRKKVVKGKCNSLVGSKDEYGVEQCTSNEDNDLIVSDLVLEKYCERRCFEGWADGYKSLYVATYVSDVYSPSDKAFTCDDQWYEQEEGTEQVKIKMSDKEATEKNEDNFYRLKFDIWKWQKRKKVAGTKCKIRHGKWKFDIWKWPKRKRKVVGNLNLQWIKPNKELFNEEPGVLSKFAESAWPDMMQECEVNKNESCSHVEFEGADLKAWKDGNARNCESWFTEEVDEMLNTLLSCDENEIDIKGCKWFMQVLDLDIQFIEDETGGRRYTLNIWDVGGQKTIRSYWRNYFEQTDGLVWVVDSSDLRRLADCKYELDNLLKEERLSGASLLVFANKQDIQGALSPDEIAKVLNLDAMDKTRHWKIVGCSAYTGDGLLEGFDWLVQDIASRIYVLD
ncbi:Small GTPase superfamily, ARF/SAR type [Artemisia annua]|uniref:ADP-ribosylation factor 1 n=1 Tax=Artemisia annua TaxID=35608 RepID=A0A2U1MMW8_ARTAN|nr:Small GTPase superfamily, ARF/SAR type [Artemisia annua]